MDRRPDFLWELKPGVCARPPTPRQNPDVLGGKIAILGRFEKIYIRFQNFGGYFSKIFESSIKYENSGASLKLVF